MADPLSAIASIVGVTEFGIKGINSLRYLYRSHKDAPKQMEQLRNEAHSHWAVLMQLGRVFDAAAEIGDESLGRMILELGEKGNAHLNELDKLLANDDQADPTTRPTRNRKGFVENKLRHLAKRYQLKAKHRLAMAHKRDFEKVRESMNLVLLAENTRSQSIAIQPLATLGEKATQPGESNLSSDSLIETSPERIHNTLRCTSGCLCACHNHMRRFPAHLLPNSIRGIWQAMNMACFRTRQPNAYCHGCRSVPRAKVAGIVKCRLPTWFGSLVVQFSIGYSLRRGFTCGLKASQRVENSVGDIFWCVESGDSRDLQSLLKKYPAAVNNQQSSDGRAPLLLAINRAEPDIVTLLLENGADVTIEDDAGLTAATALADFTLRDTFPRGSQYQLYAKLSAMETLNDTIEDLQFGILHKIVLGLLDTDLCKYLGGLEEAERLEQIHHIDGFQRTPLHWAAARDDVAIVGILLSFGAESDARDICGFTPLSLLAMSARSAKSFKPLVQKGANIYAADNEGASVAHLAARFGSLELLEKLHLFGAVIEAPTTDGTTPMMIAANHNQSETVERLLEWGAAVDATDEHNCTALYYAIAGNAHETIALLLSKKANPQHVNKYGQTIWHYAAVAADAKTMEILQSINPTSQDLTRRCRANTTPFTVLRCYFRDRQEVWDMFESWCKETNGS